MESSESSGPDDDPPFATGLHQGAPAETDRPEPKQSDSEQVDKLRRSGFQGAAWQEFAEELFLFGQRVLRRWFGDGTIVGRCRDRKLLSSSTTWRLWSTSDQHDLLMDTLMNSVAAFREVLRSGYWDPSGGASLRTFFVGQVLIQFARAYRRFLSDQEQIVLVDPERLFRRGDVSGWTEPERVAVVNAEIRAKLTGLSSPRSRQVVVLNAFGYSDREIGSILGMSVRAVEGRLRRARKKLQQLSREWNSNGDVKMVSG